MMKKVLSALFAITLVFALLTTAQADFNETYYNLRFNISYAVYTGPGTSYYRANGNAMYGGGVARYYGTASNGWLFIGYETSGGLWRMGYIEPGASAQIKTSASDYSIFNISFTSTAAYVKTDTFITDDPLYGDKTPLTTLGIGQQVTVLGYWNDYWAYVEVQKSGMKTIRGFIMNTALSSAYISPAPVTATPAPTARVKETRVSVGYIDSMYTSNSRNYFSVDRVDVTYQSGTNVSTFINGYSTLFKNVCSENCLFYYGTMENPIRTTSYTEFKAHYMDNGSALYRFFIMNDEIVAVMPYAADY